MCWTNRLAAFAAYIAILGGTAVAADFRLKLALDLGREIDQGTVLITVQAGAHGLPNTRTEPVTGATREVRMDLRSLPGPADGEFVYFYGKLVAANQETIGFVPVTVIDFRPLERRDLVEQSAMVVATEREALVRSFPLVPSIPSSIASYSVESVLAGTKILFSQKLIREQDEWDRLTSDFLRYFSGLLVRDSSQIAVALQYLDDYIGLADNSNYDSFYVEFLLKLKEARIGGAIIGDQTLDDLIFSSLNRMFADRIVSTFKWSPNTIRIYRENNPPTRSRECLALSTLLMNVIDGAINSAKIDVSHDYANGTILSFLQASSECAQEHFIASGRPDANRLDVAAAARFLRESDEGETFLGRYMTLFETLERLGLMPRRPRGPLATRIREISKYYENFASAAGEPPNPGS